MKYEVPNKMRIFQLFVPVLFACMAVSTFAQSDTSSVSGTVTDAQGAAVADVTVTVSKPERNITRTTQTSADGVYSFVGIPPGEYIVTATKSGFKKFQVNGVQAQIASTATMNIALEIGNVNEVVTVTSSQIESIINTQDASIGNTFRPSQIQQLPTDSRNINSLLSLQPGVTQSGYVNGGRSDQANITIDGIDVNDQQTGAAFSSVLRSLAEATEEFRVTTTNANADQGRSSGAQISLLTKSGKNEFNGAAFWLPRRTFGSANNFFNNATVDPDTGESTPRPNIDRDVFGGAIGGPIVRDKLFFFYAYEGWRQNVEVPTISTVPTATLAQGIVRFCSPAPESGEQCTSSSANLVSLTPAEFGTRYPSLVSPASPNGQNPIGLAALASAASRYPCNSTRAGDGLNTCGFSFNAPSNLELNAHVLRFDWSISPSQQLFFKGQKQHDVSVNAPAFPDEIPMEDSDHNTGVAVGHTWSIGTNKVNNFRYGMTRQAYTRGGNATTNSQSFRFVYAPTFGYGLTRVTPIHNITDDFTWTKGNHTIQFGGNIRLITNKRADFGPGYDNAVINPSYYSSSGRSLLTPLNSNPGGYGVATNNLDLQAAVAAVIGRYSQYTANYNYDKDGTLLPLGTPINRVFATEEYDLYVQDSWKIRQDLTLNLGLRYALSRPVYEKEGYQVRPSIPLGEYFERRIDASERGEAYNETLNFELAGPVNDAKGWYKFDTNNFQPRVSLAWSPSFKSGFGSKLFGAENESVFRGGFAITNDYFGQQLAVTFDGLGTLGFLTSDTIAPNTFNVTSNPGPLFTGFGQQVNNLPGMAPLDNRFQTPADEDTRIELSLDSTLQSPINYSWNFTYGRKLPKGFYIETSYVGRKARNLLVQRDIMALNNLVDPISGTDWYTAGGKIHDIFYSGVDYTTAAAIPYFENLWPTLGASLGFANSTQGVLYLNEQFAYGDWTYLQYVLDDDYFGSGQAADNLFFNPQYGAFAAFSTVGKSDYHGGSISLRQRLGESLTLDFNYTFSKSMDDASGLQTSGSYGSAFVLNALRQEDSWARSDFDTRHIVNANGIWQLPFGRGRKWLRDSRPWADAVVGGWQLGGIFRWNSGQPFNNLIDLAGWATNWNIRSSVVRTQPIQSSITRNGEGGSPNLFSDLDALVNSVRPPRPGETGDRNVFFGSSFSQLDLNLGKSFTMPWSENHRFQFRWEVFNVFNKQYFDENSSSAFSVSAPDPYAGTPAQLSGGTGTLTDIRGIPRRMQFVLRYSF
jgi:hypothetical protein